MGRVGQKKQLPTVQIMLLNTFTNRAVIPRLCALNALRKVSFILSVPNSSRFISTPSLSVSEGLQLDRF
eukprot:m.69573 g.69573  ORF g.69573 m.69573 type:complete len:69 (-) comp24110_c0_seq1:115-321(-)